MKNNIIRLAGIAYESLVNGPGLRRVFFAQGCAHNCDGCFNPSTHDFNGGELRNIDDLIEDVKINPLIKGITFSGGDPFYQAEAFAYMAEEIKKLKLNIWCYTGYKIEDILNNSLGDSAMHLLKNLDVLVDGKFDKNKMDDKIKFRGSSNQRIIDVQQTLKNKSIVTFDI
ncbi:anaerobic ribonucleoside-triphosphate reductase activating protein [Clostridium sp. cel8]|jgi:anaerobic ribonucleoside-triphosphate reductase activating protein|uniref:anaerobic ribonucleoside-triphosphate reductase activating protein n=1 Tax=unclassified Clostridium TaxID=2614128 RepID=UPI0015F7580F|nr:anaerobic ribonucleoside-triphosphate reductase activating protein [Clostridium sp. cel8]MBA5851433.1 anaerobic ribonucleoside-triphosphate reductase activating protein [Clostridium sp. cel8]